MCLLRTLTSEFPKDYTVNLEHVTEAVIWYKLYEMSLENVIERVLTQTTERAHKINIKLASSVNVGFVFITLLIRYGFH